MIASDMTPQPRIGSIEHAGQLIDPDQAIALGDAVRAQHDSNIDLHSSWYGNPAGQYYHIDSVENAPATGEDDDFSRTIYLAEGELAIVKTAGEKFGEIASKKLNPQKTVISSDILVGTGATGMWHTDGGEDYRGLVNISPAMLGLLAMVPSDVPTQLRCGFEWNTSRGPALERQQGILFFPGEVVAIDNITVPSLQIPHAGVPKSEKILLRLFAQQY